MANPQVFDVYNWMRLIVVCYLGKQSDLKCVDDCGRTQLCVGKHAMKHCKLSPNSRLLARHGERGCEVFILQTHIVMC
jgi:hypothetical protein